MDNKGELHKALIYPFCYQTFFFFFANSFICSQEWIFICLTFKTQLASQFTLTRELLHQVVFFPFLLLIQGRI